MKGKPKGFMKKRRVVYPITVSSGKLKHATRPKFYKLPKRSTRIIAFDIDGTLECGRPPGKIPISELKRLKEQGHTVGVISNSIQREKVREALGDIPDFLLTKSKIKSMRATGQGFSTKLYVGNSWLDEKRAKLADWAYVKADDYLKPKEPKIPSRLKRLHDARPIHSDEEYVITKDGKIWLGNFGKEAVYYDENIAKLAVQRLEERGAYMPDGFGLTSPKHKWGYITRKRKDKLWTSLEKPS